LKRRDWWKDILVLFCFDGIFPVANDLLSYIIIFGALWAALLFIIQILLEENAGRQVFFQSQL